MIITALVAIQVALVASEPTVLLQTQGNWAGESEFSSLEAAAGNYVRNVITQDDPAPALLNLLKAVTKTDKNGEEYLELKPLISMVMDTGRHFVKHIGEHTSPKILEALEHLMVTAPEAALGHTLATFDKLFLTKGENTEMLDIAIAVRLQQASIAFEKAITQFMPQILMFGNQIESLLDIAQTVPMGGPALEKLASFRANLKSTRQMVNMGSEGLMQRLDLLKRSSIKDGVNKEQMKQKVLKRKAKSTEKIMSLLYGKSGYVNKMKGVFTYTKDNLNVIIDTIIDIVPAPMLDNPHAQKALAALHERTATVETRGWQAVETAIDAFASSLKQSSHTLM